MNVLTVRAGETVYDRDARAFPDWKAGAFAGSDTVSDPRSGTPTPTQGRQEPARASAQNADPVYDLLLKNGNLIDPSSGRNGRLDIAIVGQRIARIAASLPAHHAKTTVDVSAYYVTPGLIDLHA